MLLGKGVLKLYNKFTGEQSSRSAISIRLQSNYIEIALQHGCSPVNLLHIFTAPFHKNTSGGMLSDSWLNGYTGFKTFSKTCSKCLTRLHLKWLGKKGIMWYWLFMISSFLKARLSDMNAFVNFISFLSHQIWILCSLKKVLISNKELIAFVKKKVLLRWFNGEKISQNVN